MNDEMPEKMAWESGGEYRQGRRTSGSVVQSVRFGLAEIRLIRDAARQAGMTTSEYIREAALTRVRATSTDSFTVTGGQVGEVFRPTGDGTSSDAPRFIPHVA